MPNLSDLIDALERVFQWLPEGQRETAAQFSAYAVIVAILLILVAIIARAFKGLGGAALPTTGNAHLDALLELERRGKLNNQERQQLKTALFAKIMGDAGGAPASAESQRAFDEAVDKVLETGSSKQNAATLAAFATDPAAALDQMLADAKTVEDYNSIAALAFPIDTKRAERALEGALKADPNNGESLHQLARVRHRQGRIDEATALWSKLRSPERSALDRSRGHYGIGWLLGEEHKTEAALKELGESLRIAEAAKLDGLAASAVCGIGLVQQRMEALDDAERSFRDAEQRFQALGREDEQANCMIGLGNVYFERKDIDNAEREYLRVADIGKKLNSKDLLASAYGNLGNIAEQRGERDQALNFHRESLRYELELGRKREAGVSYVALGNIFVAQQNGQAADEQFNAAIALHEEVSDKARLAETLLFAGASASQQGQKDRARGYWTRALGYYEELGLGSSQNANYLRHQLGTQTS